MAQQHFNPGALPDGVGGDTIRSANEKWESNFNDIYSLNITIDGNKNFTGNSTFRSISIPNIGDPITAGTGNSRITIVGNTGVSVYGPATNSSSSQLAYGALFDSRLPAVNSNIFARFQALDIFGGSSYARIAVANSSSSLGEYRFAHTGTATAVLWQNTSDERIKADFIEIDNPLDMISEITGYSSFTKLSNAWEHGRPERVLMSGVKAQDVMKVLPAAISDGGSGFDNDGNPIESILGVDPLGLCALLIEAVKELHSKVKALEESS